MKIVHINTYYRPYAGTETYLFDICRAIEDKGHEIVIITSSDHKSINTPGRKIYPIKGSTGIRTSLKAVSLMREIMEKENPDVLHLHNTQGFISPFILKYLVGVRPVVMTFHDSRPVCPADGWKVIPSSGEICLYPFGMLCFKKGCYPFGRYNREKGIVRDFYKFLLMICEKRSAKKADRILVASSFMYEDLIRNGYSHENVVLLPLYTEKASNLKSGKKKGDMKTVLFAGRLERIKGVMHFIESLHLLKSNQWQAVIIGEGAAEEEAKSLVEKMGLHDKVRFLGKISGGEVDNQYAACSIVVFPSIYPEPFGLTGIEAMASGKPVVAFDSGGPRDWLVDNETGFLVGGCFRFSS